ncbi:unnamed protein product [Rotaria sp. Silwood1]|nr:unnamed protein product [Rotaria sp. Silwood1]CAF4035083.1 unnamed protein product [Rotaria sp. Silwood1]CAF4992473.1 unnamed protein product [Rotaria sp. Silwood1]CAF5018212.1 unnamed protein product [Rotaria sp. Silwood1]
MNVWAHVACVYDSTTQTQQLWLNGVLDASRWASPYLGTSGNTLIGAISYSSSLYSFNGYIDQVRYTARVKNSTELLNDASQYVYYSFDGGSIIDNGPNGINATISGTLSSTTGRVNQALQFGSGSYLYYTYAPFYFLGISDQPFSIGLWAKPTGSLAASTLVFVTVPSWCVHFLVMTSSGQLTANLWNGGAMSTNGPTLSLNTWTHIGYTYSYSNGIKLYINGNYQSTTGSFHFSASGVAMYIRLGSDGGSTSCTPGYGGQFTGALDEFYLYKRELTASEIWALANP